MEVNGSVNKQNNGSAHNEAYSDKALHGSEPESASMDSDSQRNFANQLARVVSDLYQNDLYSDLTVRIGGLDKEVPAHRLVVAARTAYWGDLAGNSHIELKCADPTVGMLLLRWIYTDELNPSIGDDSLLELLRTALEYRVSGLSKRCEVLLKNRLEVSSCLKIYQFADKLALEELRLTCEEFVSSHWADFPPAMFKEMSASLLYEMLKRRSGHLLGPILGVQREDVLELFLEENQLKLSSLLNTCDENGKLPLDSLLMKGQLRLAERLVASGADVNQLNASGKSLIWRALERGDASMCKFLLEKGIALDCIEKSTGDGLLHVLARAATKNMGDIAVILVDQMDVNLRNLQGRTPLMLAIESDYGELIELLLARKGLAVNQRDNAGKTAIEMALLERKSIPLASLLLERSDVDLNSIDSHGMTMWHRAVQTMDFSSAQFLSISGADVNLASGSGATTLHLLLDSIAPHGGTPSQMDMLRLVLKSGADVFAKETDSGSTSIHVAVQRGGGVLEAILGACHQGSSMNVLDNEGRSPLWCALISTKLDAAKRLIEAGADVNECNSETQPLLTRAIKLKRDDLARFLLDARANPNAGQSRGISSLNLAVEQGLTATVNYLCKLGADPNIPSRPTGLVPLWTALANDDYGTAEVLVDHGCDLEGWAPVNGYDALEETLLHRAISGANTRAAIFLIRSGCNVNVFRRPIGASKSERGTSLRSKVAGGPELAETSETQLLHEAPLHMSVRHGLTDVTRALLSNLSCKIAAQDEELRTAAHLAVEKEDAVILELLLAHPDILAFGLRDARGRTPLTLAIKQHSDKLTEMIYRRLPAVASQSNELGENILHEAVKAADLESVLSMLALQFDVNVPTHDVEKNTALHLCSDQKDDELIMRNLILAGAEVNKTNAKGWTALHAAARNGRTALCRVLIENGADANIQDVEGNNALHMAVMNGFPDVVQYFLLESDVNHMAVNKNRQNILHLCATNVGIISAELFITILEILPTFPLESTDMHGNTVFLLAFLNGNAELCKLALKNGCCMGVVNHQGQSAFNIETTTKQILFSLLDGLDREPQWSEGEDCSECKSKFTLTMRKHHCRHCGRLVCAKCSDHQMPILKFNNSKMVRVCQICLDVLTGGNTYSNTSTITS